MSRLKTSEVRTRPAGDEHRVAEEAGRGEEAAIALGLRGGFVEEDGVGVADGAGELAAAGVVDFVGDGLRLFADGGAHLVGDDGGLLLGHGRLLLGSTLTFA